MVGGQCFLRQRISRKHSFRKWKRVARESFLLCSQYTVHRTHHTRKILSRKQRDLCVSQEEPMLSHSTHGAVSVVNILHEALALRPLHSLHLRPHLPSHQRTSRETYHCETIHRTFDGNERFVWPSCRTVSFYMFWMFLQTTILFKISSKTCNMSKLHRFFIQEALQRNFSYVSCHCARPVRVRQRTLWKRYLRS